MEAYLSLDALDRVDHHSNGPLRQRLEALLGVDVHARQPAAEPGVTVVPADHHLRPVNTQSYQSGLGQSQPHTMAV